MKGVYQTLPLVAFLAAGGWAGWEFLGPIVDAVAWGNRGGQARGASSPLIRRRAQAIAAFIGAIAGWALSGLLESSARLVVLGVQCGLRLVHERLHSAGWILASCQFDRAGRLRRAALPDLSRFQADAHRLHSDAGQRLFAGQRPASRFRLFAAHRGSHEADRRNRSANEGSEGSRRDRRAIDFAGRKLSELRCALRDARRFRKAARLPISRPTRSPLGWKRPSKTK